MASGNFSQPYRPHVAHGGASYDTHRRHSHFPHTGANFFASTMPATASFPPNFCLVNMGSIKNFVRYRNRISSSLLLLAEDRVRKKAVCLHPCKNWGLLSACRICEGCPLLSALAPADLSLGSQLTARGVYMTRLFLLWGLNWNFHLSVHLVPWACHIFAQLLSLLAAGLFGLVSWLFSSHEHLRNWECLKEKLPADSILFGSLFFWISGSSSCRNRISNFFWLRQAMSCHVLSGFHTPRQDLNEQMLQGDKNSCKERIYFNAFFSCLAFGPLNTGNSDCSLMLSNYFTFYFI